MSKRRVTIAALSAVLLSTSQTACSEVYQNRVTITDDQHYRYIASNAFPDHTPGVFPNSGNPNHIKPQNLQYRIPLTPQIATSPQNVRIFGVALNGVPFEPGTAECYGVKRPRPASGRKKKPRQRPTPMSDCQWREEAIVAGKARLGLDQHHAHVQPSGLYHYHGIPSGLVQRLKTQDDLVHVGYAADGYRIMVSQGNRYQSGYQRRSGTRPTDSNSPGGAYDGHYTQDFVFHATSGDLDQCNGLTIQGEYVYLLSTEFPYIPRCWQGVADQSFQKKR